MAGVIPGAVAGSKLGLSNGLRRSDAASLAAALVRGREQLLALFGGFEQALGPDGLHIAYDPRLNLPLWELGHIGWFEERWLARNQQRSRGAACDPLSARTASLLEQADSLYDSSTVAHATRWLLPLPNATDTRRYLAAVREGTLALLHSSAPDDDALYFFRWVLFHEDMHREAWYFMAQQLGIDLGVAMQARQPNRATVQGEWQVAATQVDVGSPTEGFAFDNERAAHPQALGAFSIDRAAVTWARFLPFVESGGYADSCGWSPAGAAWREAQAAQHPRHLRRHGKGWQQQRFGAWVSLDEAAPALHLSAHEAEAWCRWAGRRLPTEAEWEMAATHAPALGEAFEWGEVWEWTASPFAPYPGFVPHPYRDYSAPWFDGRPVLRGASFATTPHMKHPHYRNFFEAHRNDVFAGFRSCAAG